MRVRARVRRGEFLFFYNSKYKLVSCSICVARIGQLMLRSVSLKRPVVLWEMTCRFMKSDVLFYEKRRVVLWEMSCYFMRNDVLFYEKWRVVLWETTCCFMRNDVLFVQDNILVVQFYDFALLRVRALFFIRSYHSPLRGRLTTKHLPNNGIRFVPDLMSDWGLSRPSTLCSRT